MNPIKANVKAALNAGEGQAAENILDGTVKETHRTYRIDLAKIIAQELISISLESATIVLEKIPGLTIQSEAKGAVCVDVVSVPSNRPTQAGLYTQIVYTLHVAVKDVL